MVKKSHSHHARFLTQFKQILFSLCCIAFTQAAHAESQTGVLTDSKWSFSLYGGQTSIDETASAAQGIEDSAWLIGVSADYIQNNWVSSIGVDLVLYDDNNKFSQTVEGTGLYNNGDISDQSSNANGGVLYVASGYQWLFGQEQDSALRLQAGYGIMSMSERRIENCTNCYSEDIDVDAGLFVKSTLLHSSDNFSFGVYLQQYVGDGLSTGLGLTVTGAF